MNNIENILRSLEANAAGLKDLCYVKACSPNLLADLNKALEQGALLSANIDLVMAHLLDLKMRLTDEE